MLTRVVRSRAERRVGRLTHPLITLVTIALCATIVGVYDFVALAARARRRKDWLGRALDLSRGILAHDRFDAIFRRLDLAEFERCLLT